MTGHLASCLRDLEETILPPEVRQTLVERQRAQIFFTLRLTAELFRILESFTSEGIGALLAKGPVLAVKPMAIRRCAATAIWTYSFDSGISAEPRN